MDMQSNANSDAMFKEKQMELKGMLNSSAGIISGLNMGQSLDSLKKLGEDVHGETFKIQVAGSFKNGKTAFINALLGDEALPVSSLPCTAVTTELKWGDCKKASVHFRSPLPGILPKKIPARAEKHLGEYGMENVPPLEIPYNEIADYAAAAFGENAGDGLLGNPYSKIELFWPLELLRDGIEIIDSPSFDRDPAGNRAAMEHPAGADAILFILNAEKPCPQEEMVFIEKHLNTWDSRESYFVVNRFDCIPEREKGQVERLFRMKLKDYTDKEVYFISALDALNGRLRGDRGLYGSSGMPQFEKYLSESLKGKWETARLVQPARELKRILTEEALSKAIPREKKLLASSLDKMEEDCERDRDTLESLRAAKESGISSLLLDIELYQPQFQNSIKGYISDLVNRVPGIVQDCKLNAVSAVIPGKKHTGRLLDKIYGEITRRIGQDQQEWLDSSLQPAIDQKREEIFNPVEADLAKLPGDTGRGSSQINTKGTKLKSLPPLDRGARIPDGQKPGTGDFDKTNGLLMKFKIVMALTVLVGIPLVSLSIPFWPLTIIIIAIIVMINVSNWKKKEKQLKNMLTEQIQNQLRKISEQYAYNLSKEIEGKLREQAGQLENALNRGIVVKGAEINKGAAELEKEKKRVSERKAALKGCELEIKELVTQLDRLFP